jgi:pseudouridine-5'-phosphate glycosidase
VAPIVSEEVRGALDEGRGVVALESTLITHGLPAPDNLDVALGAEQEVRAGGAIPATVAVLSGSLRVGLTEDELGVLAELGASAWKLSLRDLGPALARGATGGTTVAATAWAAAHAGIEVFATGGLGGVHLGARETWDVSADLLALRRAPVVVVCSGVKSILDVSATLEVLESASVTLGAYRSDFVPGFYVASTSHPAPWRFDSPEEVVAAHRAARAVSLEAALVVANPPDPALTRTEHDRLLAEAGEMAAARSVAGKEVTPFLLAEIARLSGGRTLAINKALVTSNAHLAAAIATALAASDR